MVKCVWFIKIYSNLFLLQIKNEELCRIQNELEQECDQLRKLKKMIQEHGLPNHEQLIVLQQQVRVKSFFKDGVSPMQKVHWGSSSFLTSFIQVKSRNVGKMIPLVISFFWHWMSVFRWFLHVHLATFTILKDLWKLLPSKHLLLQSKNGNTRKRSGTCPKFILKAAEWHHRLWTSKCLLGRFSKVVQILKNPAR